MTIKTLLEIAYGIDFNTLNFETKKGWDCCSVKEIKDNLANAEINIIKGTRSYEIDDFDVEENEINLYLM